jgi:hypothetical protein
MGHIERLTWISVARGCGFGALAIFTLMVGFIATPATAFEAGGFGFLMMAAILWLKARNVDAVPYRKTEVWVMLDEPLRPPAAVAATLIAGVRREVMLHAARYSAFAAIGCLALALVLLVTGLAETGIAEPRFRAR